MVSTPDRIHFGNITEQEIETLWNGPRYQEFRDQLSSDEPPQVCRSCSIYSGTF
jgi:radical SAM protein with 4Fe4S-binding SPASM domain